MTFAFKLGAQMYAAGNDIHANPYKVGTSSWREWRRGWNFKAVKP